MHNEKDSTQRSKFPNMYNVFGEYCPNSKNIFWNLCLIANDIINEPQLGYCARITVYSYSIFGARKFFFISTVETMHKKPMLIFIIYRPIFSEHSVEKVCSLCDFTLMDTSWYPRGGREGYSLRQSYLISWKNYKGCIKNVGFFSLNVVNYLNVAARSAGNLIIPIAVQA